ncbi:MAG: ATP-binding protein [Verrucomicrobiales bacterium]
MSLAAQLPSIPSKREAPISARETAIVVIEGRSLTPLGPKIVFANERASRLSGYEINSLVGSPIGLIYDHADLGNLIEKLPRVATRPSFCWMDRSLFGNGGRRQQVHWTIRPTNRTEDSCRYFTLTFSPVAPPPPKETPARTKPRSESIEVEMDRSRSESLALTAAGVAHDFKNALQAIKSNLEMARLVTPPGGKLEAYLGSAHFALSDAEILARQMVAFTRGGTGEKHVFHVGDLLERVCHLCTAGSRIRSQLSIPEELRRVEGDPNRIYQVLHNLVINGCQSMPSGGILHISAGNADLEGDNPYSAPRGRYTVVSVRDRGCGIPAEDLPHVFDSHFTTKADGTGLGLASCKVIVEEHGGVIRAASRLGVGTEFLVFLPSSTSPNASVTTTTEPSPPRRTSPRSKPPSGTGRILVVEDQPEVAKAACGLLKHLGYESICSSTGEDAIHRYREKLDTFEPFDAVLLDMTLPGGLTGTDVMRELRRFDHEVKVVATSGYFDDDSGDCLARQGFLGLLPKPYSFSDLAEAIASALSV